MTTSSTSISTEPGCSGSAWLAPGSTASTRRAARSPTTASATAWRAIGSSSILEDGDAGDRAAGNLWIATGRGLSKLDRDRKTFHTYDTSDGLPLTEYNRGHYKTRSGELLLGSAQGLIAFDPAAVQGDRYVPPVVFTDFLLANKPVPIGDDSPLKQAIDQTETIELTYADRVVSFEFAALSYRAPRQNRYRYRLEGFDQRLDRGRRDAAAGDLHQSRSRHVRLPRHWLKR